MKLILFLLCCLCAYPIYSQSQDSLSRNQEMIIITEDRHNTPDSSQIKILRNPEDKSKGSSVSELFILGKNTYKKGDQVPSGYNHRFKGHWSGFQYGFINFTKVPEAWKNLELDWGHSFAMQFNLCKYSINLSRRKNFGLVTGMGLEYQRLRFNNDNVSIRKNNGTLDIISIKNEYENIDQVKRSTFKNLYLTIPLLMEVQFPARNRNRMYISGGFMGGIRMHSKAKIVYKDDDGDKYKKKIKGNFNMVPFKADAVARIGFRNLNVWGSYTLTNMFKSSDTPDLHLYTVGIGLTFGGSVEVNKR